MYMCVFVSAGLCMLAACTDSLGVKYLAVLVFVMSPKAMSGFAMSIRFVRNICVCVCVHLCICPAWYQPRSYAKLPISEAQSIKTPLTILLRKKKTSQTSKTFSYAAHRRKQTHIHVHKLCICSLCLLLSGNFYNLRPNPFSEIKDMKGNYTRVHAYGQPDLHLGSLLSCWSPDITPSFIFIYSFEKKNLPL